MNIFAENYSNIRIYSNIRYALRLTQASEFKRRADNSMLDLRIMATSKWYLPKNTVSNICIIWLIDPRPLFFLCWTLWCCLPSAEMTSPKYICSVLTCIFSRPPKNSVCNTWPVTGSSTTSLFQPPTNRSLQSAKCSYQFLLPPRLKTRWYFL